MNQVFGLARAMIDRTMDRLGLWPERLAADSAHGSAETLDRLVHERGIEPHISDLDKSARSDKTLERAHFGYDHHDDSYACPGGKRLVRFRNSFRTAPFRRRRVRRHALPHQEARPRRPRSGAPMLPGTALPEDPLLNPGELIDPIWPCASDPA